MASPKAIPGRENSYEPSPLNIGILESAKEEGYLTIKPELESRWCTLEAEMAHQKMVENEVFTNDGLSPIGEYILAVLYTGVTCKTETIKAEDMTLDGMFKRFRRRIRTCITTFNNTGIRDLGQHEKQFTFDTNIKNLFLTVHVLLGEHMTDYSNTNEYEKLLAEVDKFFKFWVETTHFHGIRYYGEPNCYSYDCDKKKNIEQLKKYCRARKIPFEQEFGDILIKFETFYSITALAS